MRLDRRFAVVVGFSLLWALLVSAGFYRIAGSSTRRRPTASEKTLVVASRPLPFGTVINAESVKTIRMPENLFPKGGFSRMEDVLERPVVSPIEPGEPVVEARIAARGSGAGLAPMIPPGMRAISVRVNDVVGVAGFVLPGMRVDVLVTGRPPGRDDTVTTTALQNITVLSAGQTIQADARSPSISVPVVTLLVNPAQAEALTLANIEGHIQLVLRNSTDQKMAPTPGRQLRELYALERPNTPVESPPGQAAGLQPPRGPARPRMAVTEPAPVVRAPPVAAVALSDEVVVIRGSQKTVELATRKMAN